MRRFDLRKSQNLSSELENLCAKIAQNEVLIIIFTPKNYDQVQQFAKELENFGLEIYNLLQFNQIDWEIIAKKVEK